MSKKKKNVEVSASATLPTSSSRNDYLQNKEISGTDDYEYDYDDTSSDSGKSEFDEDYERNRPPIVPIDRSRVRRVNKIPNTTNIDNASCNVETIKENETLPDIKISKSKKKRLRRRQRRLKNEKLNETSTITIETELPGKQESNDVILIKTLSTFYQGFIETLSTTENDKIENNKIDYESDKGNSSSDSGKDEFDEDYERNRPPIVPIDRSRVRQVATNIETIKASGTLSEIKISKSKRKRLRRQQRRLEYLQKSNDTPTNIKQESDNGIAIEQKVDDTIVGRKQRDKRGRKVKTKDAKKRNFNRKNEIDAPLTYAEVLKKEFVRAEGLVDATVYESWASASNSYCQFLAFIECIEGAKWTIQYDHFPALVDTTDDGVTNIGKYHRNRRNQRLVSLAQSLETDNERNNIRTLTKTDTPSTGQAKILNAED